jgi:nucleoside-diphosphate-sugar epimerase
MNAQLHVLFGAGQVGRPLAQLLLDAGKRVRVAKRSSTGVPSGVEVIRGDAADPGFCAQAAEGAATVYHCMNPPYDARIWAELVPRYMENLITAAARTGARLVVLDNVYMLGRPGSRPLDEDTPSNPCSRKGEIRARAAERLFEAHRRGDVVATAGRASDYYGPGGTLTHLGDQFWRPALSGKRARVLVNPDTIHTYHYIPDVAAGLLSLGCAESDVCGRPWMLPCAPAGTMGELVARFSSKLGREIKLTGVPRWIVKAMALFVPLIREVDEMLYQWDEPFVISDRRFRERFGQEPADVDEAAVATVAWAQQHYATTPVGTPAAGKDVAANRDPHGPS